MKDGDVRKLMFGATVTALSLMASVGFCQFSSWTMPSFTTQIESIRQRIGIPTLDASVAFSGSITARANATGNWSATWRIPRHGSVPIYLAGTGNANTSGEGRLRFDARGFWLGASLPIELTNSLTFNIRGAYLFPFNSNMEASGDGSLFAVVEGAVYVLPSPIPILGPFTYSFTIPGRLDLDALARKSWFYIDTEFAYSEPRSRAFLLAGLRYDRLLLTITPTAATDFAMVGPFQIVGHPALARVDAELNSITPYIGLRVLTGGAGSTVSAQVKGFPGAVFTDSGSGVRTGYFAEFKAEYVGSWSDYLSISAFLKGDAIRATFSNLNDFNKLFAVGHVPLSDYIWSSPSATVDVESSIQWSQLAIGGSLTLNFNLP